MNRVGVGIGRVSRGIVGNESESEISLEELQWIGIDPLTVTLAHEGKPRDLVLVCRVFLETTPNSTSTRSHLMH